MVIQLTRHLTDRGMRWALLALMLALVLATAPLATAEAHTRTYCGHGWSGQHMVNGTIWDIQHRSTPNYRNPHLHRNLHYWVHISMWFGAVYNPDHYRTDSCPNH